MPKTISFWDHPIATIEKALDLRKAIEALKATLVETMGGIENGNAKVAKRKGRPAKTASVESTTAKVDGRKRKRSAATIAKMKAAQKARWAKVRKQ